MTEKNKLLCNMLVVLMVVFMSTVIVFANSDNEAEYTNKEYTNKEILLMNIENYSYVMEKVNKKLGSDTQFLTFEELEEIESTYRDYKLELITNANEFEEQLIETITIEQERSDAAQKEFDSYPGEAIEGKLHTSEDSDELVLSEN